MPASNASTRVTWESDTAFRRYFWMPPRAHGDVIVGREVSFLELFYDLVYVVVISQAAHHLAGEVTWAGVGRFAVVFGLIWLAWINEAVYCSAPTGSTASSPGSRSPTPLRRRPLRRGPAYPSRNVAGGPQETRPPTRLHPGPSRAEDDRRG